MGIDVNRIVRNAEAQKKEQAPAISRQAQIVVNNGTGRVNLPVGTDTSKLTKESVQKIVATSPVQAVQTTKAPLPAATPITQPEVIPLSQRVKISQTQPTPAVPTAETNTGLKGAEWQKETLDQMMRGGQQNDPNLIKRITSILDASAKKGQGNFETLWESVGNWAGDKLMDLPVVGDWLEEQLAKPENAYLRESKTPLPYKTSKEIAYETAERDIARAKEGLGKTGQMAVDIASTISDMGYSMAVASAAGLPSAVPVFAAQSMASGIEEAKADGASDDEALAYGVLKGGLTAVTEKLVDGIPMAGKTLTKNVKPINDMITKVTQKIAKNPSGAALVRRVFDTLGEGAEEVLETAIDPLLKRLTYDENADLATGEDLLYSAVMGALASAVFNVPGAVGDVVSAASASKSALPTANAQTETDVQTDAQNAETPTVEADTETEVGFMGPEVDADSDPSAEAKAHMQNLTPNLLPKKVEHTKEWEEAAYQAKQAGERLGVKVEIVSDLPNGVEGAYRDGVIRISENAKNPLKATFVHELTHHLEATNTYGALREYVLNRSASGLDEYRQKIKDAYAAKGKTIDDSAADQEIVANYVEQHLFNNSKEIAQLANKHRGLVQVIRDWFEDLRVKFRGTAEEKELLRAQRLFEKALRETGTKGYRTSGDGQWAVSSITDKEIAAIQSVGRKSVNDFNEIDIENATPFARRYQNELGSKSPFFRAWFGDWRANDQSPIEIANVPGNTRGLQRNADTGWDINVSAKVFAESKHKGSANTSAMPYLPYINDITKKAILLDSFAMGEGKQKSSNSLMMHSMYAVADIGNGPELLKLYVEEMNDPNSQNTAKRAYQLQNIESSSLKVRSSGNNPSSINQTATIRSVADLFNAVKSKDKNFAPRSASKVVDKNGSPLVMYHGTRAENGNFYEFDYSKAVKKGGMGFRAMGKGNYFTSKPLNGTERYGSRVIPAYLSIKHPFIYEAGSSLPEQVGRKLDIANAAEMSHDNLQTALRKAGYDGVMQYDGDGNVLIAVTFDSNQIKSATENIGTYDPNNPDIRYSIDLDETTDRPRVASTTGRTADEIKADMKSTVEQYSPMDPHRQPGVREAEYPYETAQGKTMRTPQNIAGSNLVDDRMELNIEEAILDGKFAYEVSGDKEAIRSANEKIEGGNYEVLSEQAKSLFADGYRLKKEQVVFVERMIQEASKKGDVDTAMSLIADLAAYGTEQGQNIQALSMIRRMTPEGKLMVLKRQVDKANQITQVDSESKGEIKKAEREIKEIKREAFSGLEDIGVDEDMDIETAQRTVDEAIADETAKASQSGLPTAKKQQLQQKKQKLSEAEKKIRELEKTAKKLKNSVELPKETVEAMLKAKSPSEQNDLYNKALDEIASQIVASLPDKVNAWRYLAMLGNPRTHIRNMTGNATMYVTNAAKNIVKYGIESLPGVKRTTALKASKEAKAFAKEDFELNRDLITGGGKMNASDELRDRMTIFKNKNLEALRKFNTAAMKAEDDFFMRKAYESSLARYITANKKSKAFLESGSTAAESFLAKAREYAIKEAREVTFHDDSAVADWLSGITRSAKDDKLGVKAAKALVEGVLPFKKTPINVAKRGIEYSPVSLATAINKFAKGDAAGGVNDLAKGTTGTIMMAVGMALAHFGMLRTKNEEKDEVLDTQENEQNYSLRIPNEDGTVTSVSLDALMPAAMPLLVGVEVNKLAKEEGMSVMSVLESLTGIADPIVENSMLDGLNDMLTYVGYSDNALGAIFADMGESYLEQFRPSILRQVQQSIDPTVRTTYTPKDSPIGKGVETHLRSLANATPVLPWAAEKLDEVTGSDRFALQPKIDVWGNEVKKADRFGARLVQNMVLPFNVKKVTSDPVNEELRRLYNVDSTFSVLPKAADKSFAYQNENYYATPTEYTALAKEKGQTSKRFLDTTIKNAGYKALPDAKKADVISNLMKYANYKAKQDFFDGRGVDYVTDTFNGVEKAVDRGLTAEEYYIMKAQMDGGVSAAEKIPYYMDMLTNEQKKFVNSLPKDTVSAAWLERIALSNQGEDAKTTSAFDDLLIGEKKEKINYSDKASVYLSLIDSGASSKIGDKYYEYAQPAGVSVEDYMVAYFAQKDVTYPAKTKGAKAAAEKEAIDKALPNLSKKQREALYQAFKG